jgi:hypothetical protein
MVKRNIILWVIAIVISLGSARYQRMTGPTHPLEGEMAFEGNKISYYFERSHIGFDNHKVSIDVPDTTISGFLVYKRYKSYDTLTAVPMKKAGKSLMAEFPGQQAAGKTEYYIKLTKNLSFANVPPKPVVLRFRGDVPVGILLPHIIVMFAAMMLATRTGLEAFYKGAKLKTYVLWTMGLLVIGGLILGPIVQKYSFGEFWTGIPFGFDLTDNKTLIAFLCWLPGLYMVLKKKSARVWVIAAAIFMLVVYLIPHSVLGSEVDYTKTNQGTEQIKK